METGTATEAIATDLQQMHLGQEAHPLGGDDRCKEKEPLELEEVYTLDSGYNIRSLSWSPCPCSGPHTNHQSLGHKSGITGISYSNNGEFMASAGADCTMKVWSIEPLADSHSSMTISIATGKKLSSSSVGHYVISEDARGGFSCCDWSRCHNMSIGYLIASSCLFNDIYIFVQYDKRGNLAYRVGATKLDAHSGTISDLKWHPKDAGLLASAGSKGIKIWKVKGTVEYSHKPSTSAYARPRQTRKRRTSGNGGATEPEPNVSKRRPGRPIS